MTAEAIQAYKRNPGPHPVQQHAATWHDAARHRDVPVRIYRPASPGPRVPAVIFSHGLGSSCDGYSYLGRHWASHGYVAVHPTHLGSDTAALRGPGGLPPRRLADSLDDVQHWQDRPRDVSFVLDRLAEDPSFAPLVDFDRVAVAGHSYGAFTALALVGLVIDLPTQLDMSFADPRAQAAIVMSPQSQEKFGLRPDSWSRIDRPVLALTGTRDIEYGVGAAAPRRTSFDRTPGRDQYLLTIRDATHAAFDDPPKLRVRVKPRDPAHHAHILMATTAFLDACLYEDAAGQQWLLSGALDRLSAGTCRLESKHVTPAGRRAAP
jgi:predicted dienelactone hydrolase